MNFTSPQFKIPHLACLLPPKKSFMQEIKATEISSILTPGSLTSIFHFLRHLHPWDLSSLRYLGKSKKRSIMFHNAYYVSPKGNGIWARLFCQTAKCLAFHGLRFWPRWYLKGSKEKAEMVILRIETPPPSSLCFLERKNWCYMYRFKSNQGSLYG